MKEPHVIMIGFDPRKPISTVSYICSKCKSHVNTTKTYDNGEIEELDIVVCENCKTELLGKYYYEWKPPKDIELALKKQVPRKISRSTDKHAIDNITFDVTVDKCPNCHKVIVHLGANYCPNCGQRLEYPDE